MNMAEPVVLREVTGGAGRTCAEILSLLPAWFGIPSSNEDYIATADTHPGVIAMVGDEDVGITTVKHHSPYAAEVYLMAVKPAYHRHGIGVQMLRLVEERLAAQGVEFLQVKTLSAASPDAATPRPVRSGSPAGSGRSRSSPRCGTRRTRPCSSSRPFPRPGPRAVARPADQTAASGVTRPITPGRHRKTQPRRSGSSMWSAVTMYMSAHVGARRTRRW